jgi:hypothetical protein
VITWLLNKERSGKEYQTDLVEKWDDENRGYLVPGSANAGGEQRIPLTVIPDGSNG